MPFGINTDTSGGDINNHQYYNNNHSDMPGGASSSWQFIPDTMDGAHGNGGDYFNDEYTLPGAGPSPIIELTDIDDFNMNELETNVDALLMMPSQELGSLLVDNKGEGGGGEGGDGDDDDDDALWRG